MKPCPHFCNNSLITLLKMLDILDIKGYRCNILKLFDLFM